MEPFTIQCTTCKARLIVKDESVIGDILGCPKCHSMVQVVPPLGWKRPASDASSSGAFADVEVAVTSASKSAPQNAVSQHSSPQNAPPQNAAPVAKKPSTQKVVDKQAAAVIPPALPPRQAPPQSAPSQPLALPLAQVASSRTPESPSVAPPSEAAEPSWMANLAARARQDWMVLAGGLCGGVILGVTVWLVLAMQASEPKIVASTTNPAESPAETALPRPAATAVEVPAPNAALPTVEPTPPAEPAAEDAAAAVGPQDQNSIEPPQDTTSPPREAPNSAAPKAAANESGPALKLDPVPAPTSLAPLPLATPSAADTPAPDEPPPIAEPPDAAPSSPAAPTPLSAEEIDRRLAVSLGAVEFAEVTLAQFTTFIADVSGVPVTFDEKALATRGSGRRTKVTLKLQRTTAGEALRAAIESVGLTFTVSDDGQIVVTAGKD